MTAVNYGPLIDVNTESARYHDIDAVLADELGKIMQIHKDSENIIKFATNTLNAGGLQLIFPYVYQALMV